MQAATNRAVRPLNTTAAKAVSALRRVAGQQQHAQLDGLEVWGSKFGE